MSRLLERHMELSYLQSFISCVLILVCMGTVADCLLCYQCATTTPGGKCATDYEGLVNTTLGITKTYLVNCTDTKRTWDRCMIETAEINGAYVLYHRGCHDGKTFSSDFYSPRFENITPNNFSTCEQVGTTGKLICYRFCDTDFCNGPQPPPNTTDPLCEAYFEDPDNNLLPAGKTCGACGIFPGNGPISVELLCLLVTFFVVIGRVGFT